MISDNAGLSPNGFPTWSEDNKLAKQIFSIVVNPYRCPKMKPAFHESPAPLTISILDGTIEFTNNDS